MEVSGEKLHSDAASIDRLSDLPDCLLHAILSRLKARQVVQTCLLSSRWRRLWFAVPFLDIDWEFPSRRFSPRLHEEHEEEDEELDKFDDFVDNLLLRRSTCALSLHTLRLSIHSPRPLWMRIFLDHRSCAIHTRWVRRGLKSSLAVLDICGIELPSLSSGTHRLTKLLLHDVLLHQDFSSRLPLLQDLEIRNTEMSKLSRIASNTLKNLTVDSSLKFQAGNILNFVVIAPRLASLHVVVQFCSLGTFCVTIQEAPSLVQASIRLMDKPKLQQVQGDPCVFQQDRSLLTMLCKFLGSLSNVSSLELSGFHDTTVGEQHISDIPSPCVPLLAAYQFQQMVPRSGKFDPCPMLQAILDEEHNKLPMFRNLRNLVLGEREIGDTSHTLCRFLHNTPALEKLTLKNFEFSFQHFGDGIYDSNLNLVKIQYNDRDDHEGQGTRLVNNVVSMVEKNMLVTTMIHVTKIK